MILDPINSIASVDFYRKISGQSLGRSFLYMCYVAVLFSVLCTIALKVKVGPMIGETFDWLERSVPPMTYADGKITSNQTGPVKLQHPRVGEVAMVIDTQRVDAVTPQQMEEEKVMAYLTSNTFYMRQQNGKLEVYDLSKSPAGSKPVQIDGAFFRTASSVLSRVLYPVALMMTFALFLAWKGVASLVYSVLALMINAAAGGGLAYSALFNIAVYAQTLVILLQAFSLFLPFGIPAFSLISIALTGVYIWLAVKRHAAPSPLPA